MSAWPKIQAAVELIVVDNGGINRHLGGLEPRFSRFLAKYDEPALQAIEAFLGGLDGQKLEDLCMGEHHDMLAVGAPANVEAFLTAVFEGFDGER